MSRTFVHVELEYRRAEVSFTQAMDARGFLRTIKGKKTRKALSLPSGMYLIEGTSPVEALQLARAAAQQTKVRARILCMPGDGSTRFHNLQRA
jgi:hypothetical protein